MDHMYKILYILRLEVGDLKSFEETNIDLPPRFLIFAAQITPRIFVMYSL